MKPDAHAPYLPVSNSALRLDKFLWFSRLVKSRSDAAHLCESRHLRMDGRVIEKAHTPVRVGNVLSFAWHGRIFVVRVLALPERRGPAADTGIYYTYVAVPRSEHEAHLAAGRTATDAKENLPENAPLGNCIAASSSLGDWPDTVSASQDLRE